ncbi:DUF551 domain-containing protein [Klebsiella pneumoniae]|nr:DUF551 domain-containing protein [Klebsiella pneumoniae]WFA49647.1 DUF551 domain-containing protein [Klebsiella pneumoniae]
MKEELLLLRNQLKMGHRISFAEAMLLQRAIDILVNKAGNSPVIGIDLASGPDRTVEVRYVAPPGYVMVPKEPTSEMVKKMRYHVGGYDRNIKDGYKAMLAAAPQSPGSDHATVPGKWIPVSERMPDVGDIVLTAMGGSVNVGEMERSGANYRYFTSVISGRELPVTHWMPLPAAPQEVKGE